VPHAESSANAGRYAAGWFVCLPARANLFSREKSQNQWSPGATGAESDRGAGSRTFPVRADPPVLSVFLLFFLFLRLIQISTHIFISLRIPDVSLQAGGKGKHIFISLRIPNVS
jgi:hypothetical protein